ncbi:Reverse transcriptase (RNA-dependent DNA polymerase) [Fragilaria crotonensis]|nr:Reverse transcriptase (RNA-dependent DNA polymerase) [Fragilaria crotonensis]
MVAFEFSDDPSPPVGYAKATCHMIFDIKFDLTRKARLVLNGAKHEVPKEMTFLSVVSRDSVRIAFTLAALNGLDILAADIQNAYLSAPTDERLYVVAGLEFPPDLRGRPVKIVSALYGMKSSGARFRDHLAASLRDMGYVSCKADPDVWMKAAMTADGTKFYSYVLAYVADILCLDTNLKNVMDALSKVYKLNDGSVKAPDVYLGAEVKQFKIPESDEPGKIRWAMSSSKYVSRAVKDVETELENVGLGLPKRTTTPLSQGYRPELDQTAELDAQRLNYYQGLVGVLRWICKLGQVDILMPVSLMSRYLVSAREGHLQQLFHVFAYLKQYDRSTMVFDDTEPSYDPRRFATQDRSKYYPDAKEAIPENMPEPRGKPVMMTCFVDADHAGCQLTRRSHTGVILYINRAPIIWYSKRQNTVESSTFGSEFIAIKIAVELIEGLRYKLRMMGVPIEDPCNVFCDNEAVVKNSTRPESTLKKKHQAIAYHRTREAQAAGTVRIAKEDDHDSEQEPKHIQHTSPDALTSSTQADFTCPPIEDLTKTLLKYAKSANHCKLSYPTDLQAHRQHFNTFIDNLRIVCNISLWTCQVFDLWPKQVFYSHPFVGTALYNLIFTNVCDPCQKHIIDGPPDARTASLTLRRHCAPLTPDHVEPTRKAFCSIKQPHHEVATSYLNRIRLLTRNCYHAGIPNTDAELIKRTVRGGSNHSFYAASYQRFDADIRRTELNYEALPPFAELESHLLNIDESRGLTLPSQNHRNYNQHANAARANQSHHFQPRHNQTTQRVFTQRQQQAFSSIL